MKANGVAEKDIQTSQLSIYPEYNYMEDGRQELRGFRVQNTVTATLRDIDKTGEVVDVNHTIEEHLEVLAKDPWNSGWMVRLKLSSKSVEGLMDAAAYEKFVAANKH